MTTLTPTPKQQFLDANGNPLAGGKVYTYAAGTTTPLVTYTDQGGSTPNTNPVILDSRGEAAIWLGVASYKLKLTTATDVEIWTVDNIVSANVQALANLSESGGSALVGFLQSGTGAVATTVQTKLRETVSVKDFGAVGDGVTDDSAAIRAAVNYAAGSGSGGIKSSCGVYFPAGIYRVTINGVLTPTTVSNFIGGTHFYGEGMNASVLRLDTSGAVSDRYFYDNGSSNIEGFCTFSDLSFEGMNPASYANYTSISSRAKCIRLYGPGSDQGFKFTRCKFTYLYSVLETAGTDNASEVTFVQCKVSVVSGPVVYLNNINSLNFEFHATDIENVYGDVFKIGPLGGGLIKMYGGSVIMFSDSGANTYFYNSTGQVFLPGTPNVFDGLGLEFRGNFTNLINTAVGYINEIHFNDCKLQDHTTALKTSWCNANKCALIKFRGCKLTTLVLANANIAGAYTQINSGTSGQGQVGQSGRVVFDSCCLPVDFSDVCVIGSVSGGISAINCTGQQESNISAGSHWAHDFDLHWNQAVAGQYTVWDTSTTLRSAGSPQDNQLKLKTSQIKLATEYWPNNTLEHTLKLPKNAMIKSIYLRKPAGGVSAAVTTFVVGNNTKAVSHVATTSAAFNTTHSADLEKYFYHVGAAVTDRTLRFYTTNSLADGSLQGGIAWVEYY